MNTEAPLIVVDALEPGEPLRKSAIPAPIGMVLKLDTEGLESYFFADWNPILVDLLVVAAAAEFCDVARRRPQLGWSRRFDLQIAVHDAELWNRRDVRVALEDALSFLTGDAWCFSFVARHQELPRVQQTLDLPSGAQIIMPYSDGLDSRAVHALVAANEGAAGLVRVRLGAGGVDQPGRAKKRTPFAVVPYRIQVVRREETSARSRGFKFAAVTGIAALLAKVRRIVVTESGQGAFGPMLAVSGQTYPDYRVHPTFSRRMERLLMVLTGQEVRYEYPRLWNTKGETLRSASSLKPAPNWSDTRSCWQQSRHSSVGGRRRQCGICAACMLRRMSMFTAGIEEPAETYTWERLSVERFEDGAAAGFARITPALREYAIAGVLHMDHLAELADSPLHVPSLRRAARETAEALSEAPGQVEHQLRGMLERHAEEWRGFRRSLSAASFVTRLASARP
ncbi:MAG: hypothetical protein BGN99_14075 [Alphaproteobacteria bacterium 65-37]|nr:MAG: hypothetical protein BGN99_14075 [Alphaproteobacteria bacterium 65-37]